MPSKYLTQLSFKVMKLFWPSRLWFLFLNQLFNMKSNIGPKIKNLTMATWPVVHGHHLRIWWNFNHLLISIRYEMLRNFNFLLQGGFEITPIWSFAHICSTWIFKIAPFLKTHKSLIHYITNLQLSAMAVSQKFYNKSKIWQSQN